MDRFIEALPADRDDDLMICRGDTLAYQRDMTVTAKYDDSYFDKCRGYEGNVIACKINAGRVALVNAHAGDAWVLDIGIGSGEFIRSHRHAFGYDVNPRAIAWLKSEQRWSDRFSMFTAFTFWDVIEHVAEPEQYFRHLPAGGTLFASLPIFTDLYAIRESRHYRPGEHLYYFTERGFVGWMALHRFELLARQDFEIAAGRDSILSFAFRKAG